MHRLVFEKKGNAVWISHLDLMRLFQRAFKRAELPLTHTQGFNPRASVSIALPLSVGIESICELLDFELYGDPVECEEICDRLNAALIDGVRVLQVYDQGRKLKELAFLACKITLEYDNGVPAGSAEKIVSLFQREQVIVPKRTKNGIQEQNIIPMIRKFSCCQSDPSQLQIDTLICCQNPTLNPMQIAAAIAQYLPDCTPDFSKCCRLEVYDTQEKIFR